MCTRRGGSAPAARRHSNLRLYTPPPWPRLKFCRRRLPVIMRRAEITRRHAQRTAGVLPGATRGSTRWAPRPRSRERAGTKPSAGVDAVHDPSRQRQGARQGTGRCLVGTARAPVRERPGIRQETERIRAETCQCLEQQDARLRQLEARAEDGIPGADQALMEAYTMQALETGPPEPSAKDDPEEWRAFFREEYGRDMPLNAEYQAQKHRIEAAAPADVGGMAAAYLEANEPRGFDPADLAAERRGITVEELHAEADYEAEP